MKQKRFGALALVMALLLALSACGKGKDSAATAQPQNTTEIETASGETLQVTEPITADSYETIYAAFESVRANASKLESAEQFNQQEELQINTEAEEFGEPEYAAALQQMEGVEHGKLIATDGSRIYMVSGGELVIVEAAGADSKELGRTFVISTAPEGYSGNETPQAVYISGTRLYVVTYEALFRSTETDDGYSYEAAEKVHLKCYDVSDPASPTIVSDFAQSGQYLDSMMANGRIYLISASSVWAPDAENPASYIPTVTRNGEDSLLEPDAITICPGLDSTDYTIVSVVDAESGNDLATKALTGYHTWNAADGATLYLARTAYDYTESDAHTEDQYSVTDHTYYAYTRLVALSMDDTLAVTASAAVEGALFGKGSMELVGGELYLATARNGYTYQIYNDEKYGFSNTKIEEQASGSAVYVLDASLTAQRSLADIGADAPVYTIYFAGTDACVLGYDTLTPTYVIDMKASSLSADANSSSIARGLYSFGDGLAAGVALVRDESGTASGLQLSMYDVTSAPPAELASASAGSSWSTAMNTPGAVCVLRDAQTIAIPTETGYTLFTWQDQNWQERGSVEMSYVSADTQVFLLGESWYFCNDAMIYVAANADLAEQAKVEFAYG